MESLVKVNNMLPREPVIAGWQMVRVIWDFLVKREEKDVKNALNIIQGK